MIYVLPGMGADHRMYPQPWPDLADSIFPDWPVYQGERTLAEMAQSVIDKTPVAGGAWLAGSSLGGMIACEISRLVPVRGLILIGSAISKQEVGTLLNLLGPLVDLAPLGFIQQLSGKFPAEITRMFAQSDPAFLRAMCRAISQWEGLPDPSIPVFRIHGRSDRVIPLPGNVHAVLDGGHLIALTHPAECVRFVQSVLQS